MAVSVSAILLAAGRSRRMGQPKQIMSINGKPFISHCLDHIAAAGIGDIVVVLGAHKREVFQLIAGRPIKVVFNWAPQTEMADSVRLGLSAVDLGASGVLICLSDHPLVAGDTYQRLVDFHRLHPDKIVIPTFRKRRGHPVLFPKALIDQVFSGFHLRQIIDRSTQAVEGLEADDRGILWDIDTPQDYDRACRSIAKAG